MDQIIFYLNEKRIFRPESDSGKIEVSIMLSSISNEKFKFEIEKNKENSSLEIKRYDTIQILGNHYIVSSYRRNFIEFTLKYLDESKIFSKISDKL